MFVLMMAAAAFQSERTALPPPPPPAIYDPQSGPFIVHLNDQGRVAKINMA
ncbi:MAG: hypothetical protein ACTHMG_14530 [Sphingomonas sp.]